MTIESRQTITEYSDARNDIPFKNENGVEDYMALKADVVRLIEVVNKLTDNSVYSAYGALSLTSPPVSFNDIDSSWQTVDVFDTDSVITPKGINTDLSSNSLSVENDSTYELVFICSINHNSSNSGRTINIRLFDLDTNEPLANQFPVGVGRNVEDTTVTAIFPFEVTEENRNQRLSVQIGGGDTLTSVEFSSASYQIFGIGEFKGDL